MGSPRMVGLINLSRASSNPGCETSYDLRPPPLRRCRSGAKGSLFSSSCIPVRIVRSEIPVALATAMTPPRPSDKASTAAHLRRPRSSSSAARFLYLSRIHSMSFASSIAELYNTCSWQLNANPVSYCCAAPNLATRETGATTPLARSPRSACSLCTANRRHGEVSGTRPRPRKRQGPQPARPGKGSR